MSQPRCKMRRCARSMNASEECAMTTALEQSVLVLMVTTATGVNTVWVCSKGCLPVFCYSCLVCVSLSVACVRVCVCVCVCEEN